ncbi:hypothetical protein AAVH_17104 [Aphelenchoides avenae]|nr:hypothetical protein AAVH_17104 [Aphelenchus avenae]
MVHGDRQEAAVGNPEPPPHGCTCTASVKTCGNSTATYESEDDLIHCIKPNGTTASGRAALEETRILDGAAMQEALVLDDEDAALLDVSHWEADGDSDSDASIE